MEKQLKLTVQIILPTLLTVLKIIKKLKTATQVELSWVLTIFSTKYAVIKLIILCALRHIPNIIY